MAGAVAGAVADNGRGCAGTTKKQRPKSASQVGLNESVSDLDRRYSQYGGSLGGRLSTPNALRWYHESMKKDQSQHVAVQCAYMDAWERILMQSYTLLMN